MPERAGVHTSRALNREAVLQEHNTDPQYRADLLDALEACVVPDPRLARIEALLESADRGKGSSWFRQEVDRIFGGAAGFDAGATLHQLSNPLKGERMTQQSIVQHADLPDYLSELNGVGVGEAIVIEAEGTPWLAYCTDPDAEWFIESGNPADRIDEDGYQSIGLDWLTPNRGPFLVIDRRQAGHEHG